MCILGNGDRNTAWRHDQAWHLLHMLELKCAVLWNRRVQAEPRKVRHGRAAHSIGGPQRREPSYSSSERPGQR